MTGTGGRERRPPAHTAAKTGTVLADLELATILAEEPKMRLRPRDPSRCPAQQTVPLRGSPVQCRAVGHARPFGPGSIGVVTKPPPGYGLAALERAAT